MEYIIYTFSKALGWSIFHSLWQGALLFILLQVLLASLPKLAAKHKFNISLGIQALMFVAFSYTFSQYYEWNLTKINSNNITAISGIEANSVAKNFFHIPSEFSDKWFPILCMLYLVGLILQVIWLSIGYRNTQNWRKIGLGKVPANWDIKFQELLKKTKLSNKVQFYLSHHVDVPLIIGYTKPIILFPFCLVNHLQIDQVEAILLHEIAHIKRQDYLLNIFKTFFETVLFFNPFVWLTSFHIKIEREHACDDFVVKSQITPFQYAEALLSIEVAKLTKQQAFAMPIANNKYHIYQRIKRITKMKSTYQNPRQKVAMLALSIVCLLSMSFMQVKPIRANVNAKQSENLTVSFTSKTKKLKQATDGMSLNTNLATDTSRKKNKQITYITKDKNGKLIEFSDFNDLPDSLKKEFKLKMAKVDSNMKYVIQPKMQALSLKMKSKEEQLQQIEKNLKENTAAIQKNFDSKSIESSLAIIEEAHILMAKKLEEKNIALAKKFGNLDFKNQEAVLAKTMNQLEAHQKELNKKFEQMDKLQNTPEYQELKRKFDAEVKQLMQKKGINP